MIYKATYNSGRTQLVRFFRKGLFLEFVTQGVC